MVILQLLHLPYGHVHLLVLLCQHLYNLHLLMLIDKVGLGNAIGKEFRASLAVTDENLANAVIKKLQPNKTE